ncbi:hypothetical protein [Endozoicomonas sp. 8E]|uniref:hypothetical protein n=1 Tax=Endozoicomonas sp. 8E TaxID=3035692 RepID=UPI0029392389|nr:hypothetical protein [Endozoicomonas sp. 8E]WOG26013.1 hypothetical protein P6910_15695 [Endozoicomonas sp. 8E]
MYQIKTLKNLFLLTIPFFIWVQLVKAEPDNIFTHDDQASYAISASGTNACPYNQICTGDMVLITMDTDDFISWNWTLVSTRVGVAKDASDLSKGFSPVQSGGPDFHGFYYRVKPGKTYYFKATYRYYKEDDKDKSDLKRAAVYFYYKSRGDALNPVGSGAEGPVSPIEAKAMRLPPIPKCQSVKSPAQFCTNQVVHIFWSNDRGLDEDGSFNSVTDVDLYIDGEHVKHGKARDYDRGSFQDFYYTLPWVKTHGEPVNFQVTWTIRRSLISHYENSQSLMTRYTPALALDCKPTDSWEKCQHRLLE